MNKSILIIAFFFSLMSCQNSTEKSGIKVSNNEELKTAIKAAKPGDNIIMANGVWKNVQMKLKGKGTERNPIFIKAETPGEVFIEGKSYLKFGGSYWVVSGLYFRNGYTPSNAVVDFKVSEEQVADHCRLTNSVIEGFNQLSRDKKDHWVEFWGRYNQLDHCYLAGKSNEGPTVRVEIKGNENIKNFHQIVNNHFGPRPRKGGPKAETIQLGDSFSSMSPSNTLVANNLFEACNGEVEIISSKTNFNEFRNNVFYMSEGSLVTRHGNYCIIDGNYFIGDGKNENIGGIRLINTGHWVTNNYFVNLKGSSFRSPLAVMNGIPKSPLNRYNQVTDVVVAHNTWVNCTSPWQFGVGTNISQADVLPKSEIRSARPERMVVANNLIYNSVGDPNPIIEHDKADGVDFKSNIINNQKVSFEAREGLVENKFELTELSKNVFLPRHLIEGVALYAGFEFETISKDLFGNTREEDNNVGATGLGMSKDPEILDKKKYGTSWFSNEKPNKEARTWMASTGDEDIRVVIASAQDGDIIELDGKYSLTEPLAINKALTIRSKKGQPNAVVTYSGEENTPLFEMNPKGKLRLENVDLKGNGSQMAFASLKSNMSSHYTLKVDSSVISNFKFVLKAYKQSFAEEITFTNTRISNCENGMELSEETNDKGDYNVEFLTINHCSFYNVQKNVVDYYRGGYDESTIGGNLVVSNSKFSNCGAREQNDILLNHRGIVNVDISNNTFIDNKVKFVAVLWGAKNNTHANNKITKSGEIKVVENLKLTIVY